ncbi:unnamed protein product [Strongylus vulgaris]|uniref:Uncharacterized protein n=1 Tax=Strongylus vulgaris TaxID=40348 RepID=A0A3P7I3U2_STRVU|nr:unnamed protein product [Strongylus vulgaris]
MKINFVTFVTEIQKDIVYFQGYRTYVALTYASFNIVGFVVNIWVLYVVAPLLFAPAVKVCCVKKTWSD